MSALRASLSESVSVASTRVLVPKAPVWTLRGVSLGYGAAPVVQEVSGSIYEGSMTAIIGPNGGGKSTLIKGLLGLLAPISGRIEAAHPRCEIAHLSQIGEIDTSFPVRVDDFVAMGLWHQLGSWRGVSAHQFEQVWQALMAVGMQEHQRCWIGDLSGGQFQRVRFARLLVQNAPVVLLDEPFTGIDEDTTDALMQVVATWQTQGKTIIAVLHDRDLVRAHFPCAIALAGRVLAWGDTPTTLISLKRAKASPC